MKYIIGLDIGIASVGWAVINEEKHRIEDLGVRLFPKAERPKDGGAINETRREARGLRRRLKRKRIRMAKIKELFVKYHLLNSEELSNLYVLSNEDADTWKLRADGLERKLTNKEWARVLTAIAKRRGYKSNRKIEELDDSKDNGKVSSAIRLNKEYMEEKGYRTVGEMFFKDEKYLLNKRNKSGQYNNCIARKELEDEVKILFEKQKCFGNQYTDEKFEEEYLQVFNYQKPYMTQELMNKMRGKCTFEKSEHRAAKNSWTFERFMLLQKVNSLSYQVDSRKVYFDKEQRDKIIEFAYKMKSGVKYEKIRKELKLPSNAKFTGLNYYVCPTKNKDGEYVKLSEEEVIKKTEDTIFVKLLGYHEIKSALEKNEIESKKIMENHGLLDKIAEELTCNKTDIDISEKLEKHGMNQEEIKALLNVSFTKFGNLSYKAMKKMLPFLEDGMTYNKAAELAGYEFKNDGKNPKYKLPVIPKEEIRNPVVYRSVTQTRKVINAIIDKYGSPFEVHVEVARELTKNFKERKEIEKKQLSNRKINEELKNDIHEHFGINAKPVDLLKERLYREQGGKSAYSLLPIDYSRLMEPGYVEIDHVIPFSRSFDDSYNNKVLVLSKENQDKRNRTPYEYINEKDNWEKFESWVKSTYRNNFKKRDILLIKNYDDNKENDWIERNLKDTQYIARFLSNYVSKNLQFNDFGEKENRVKVKTVPGAATTALRHYWGIPSKNREENDLHHAEDAVIIACATNKYQSKIREYSKEKELYFYSKDGICVDSETGEIIETKYKDHKMVRPWKEFKEELEARMSVNPSYDLKNGDFHNYDDIDVDRINPIFVSRMPNRKVSGKAHKETVYSIREKDGKSLVTVKKPLQDISKSEIEMLVTHPECRQLYESDKEVYDKVYERMKKFNYKGEKAFSKDYVLRKKCKNGVGPIVKSIKVPSIMNAGVKVQNGIAENGNMVRVDVFKKEGKFYLVPIYVAHMVEKIPNKAIKANKPESEWIEMDDSYEFIFSLYSDDLIKIKKSGQEEIICYYISTHRGTGAINALLHDGSKKIEGVGVQNLEKFEKYEIDVLGNYHQVKNEKRKGGKNSK